MSIDRFFRRGLGIVSEDAQNPKGSAQTANSSPRPDGVSVDSPEALRVVIDDEARGDMDKSVTMLQNPAITAEELCEIGKGLERISLRLGVDPDPLITPLLKIIAPEKNEEIFHPARSEGYLPLDPTAHEVIQDSIERLRNPALTVPELCYVAGSLIRSGLRHNSDPDPVMTQLLEALKSRGPRFWWEK